MTDTQRTELARLSKAVADADQARIGARLEHDLALEKLIVKESLHVLAVERLGAFKRGML